MIYYLTSRTVCPMDIIYQIQSIDWSVGEYLADHLLNDRLAENDLIVIVTDTNNQLVGFVGLMQEDLIKLPNYGPFLTTLYVSDSYRGKGLSYYLVGLIEMEAVIREIEQIYVLTTQRGLYEKMGYSFIRELMDEHRHTMRLLTKNML